MRIVVLSVALLVLLLAGPAHAAPRVVASIKPVHALVAAVMKDVASPDLLLTGAASAHTYSLRPADAQKLAHADIIFWIGPELETFLERPLATLASQAQAVALISSPKLALRPARAGLADEHDSHALGGAHNDPHIWLDPENAAGLAMEIARVLSARDPENAARYHANLVALVQKMDAMDGEIRTQLAPVRDRPFIAYHDAYQYFEGRYGLTVVGTVTVSPDRPSGAARISFLRDALVQGKAVCLFTEPQFEPKLVKTLTEGTAAHTGVLDPEGSTLPAGPEAYFALMHALADNVVKCLAL